MITCLDSSNYGPTAMYLSRFLCLKTKLSPLICSKTCLKRPLKKKNRLSLNAGQKYCRMLQGEHSAILPTFIKLQFVFKTIVKSIFEWQLKTGFTVLC